MHGDISFSFIASSCYSLTWRLFKTQQVDTPQHISIICGGVIEKYIAHPKFSNGRYWARNQKLIVVEILMIF